MRAIHLSYNPGVTLELIEYLIKRIKCKEPEEVIVIKPPNKDSKKKLDDLEYREAMLLATYNTQKRIVKNPVSVPGVSGKLIFERNIGHKTIMKHKG
jgi:hypothetical protein